MIDQRLLIAFAGRDVPAEVASRLAARPPAGLTLFREHNVDDTAQVRRLTKALQDAVSADAGPLLIATDQEGGQLIGLGDETTQFAGPMAVGAVGDEDLAQRVGAAMARELRACGVNVNYAPCCDLATEPANPALGIRSFGDDAEQVGRMVAATVRGLQGDGVAATLKHFPGAGDASSDPHHGLPVVNRTQDELEARELIPFRAGIEAGAKLVMVGHVDVPASSDRGLPASLSAALITGLLRDRLRFNGLVITDALDMRALAQGTAQIVDAIVALRAGEDLLLGTADDALLARLDEGLGQADRRGLVEPLATTKSVGRLAELRRWLAHYDQPSLDVVGCAAHRAVADELARRSITLVRNDDGLLPLKVGAGTRVAVIYTQPGDLTPADTSSMVRPDLGDALRRRLPAVEEILLPANPGFADIGGAAERAAAADVVIVGTFAAHLLPAQAALAQAILDQGRPTVTIALRTPWDLAAYPSSRTHVCSYGILPPTTEALAGAIMGEQPFVGRLPVEIHGLYPRGHGVGPWA